MGSPFRIVSLVPSLTEFVCWMGRGDALVGRTRFCDSPPGLEKRVPSVGGTKDPEVTRIVALRPDLVLANREENRREDVEALREAGLDVLVTDPNTLEQALEMFATLGKLLGVPGRARELTGETRAALADPGPARQPRVFVAVWKRPLMGLGSATYGHDLIEQAGALNVLCDLQRYPEVTLAEIRARAPDLVLLPDEPYHFGEVDAAEYSGIAPTRLVDGRMLWWYGPRLPGAIRALRTIFTGVEPE